MPINLHWPRLALPPELDTHSAHVWSVPLDVSQRTYDGLLATLATDEQSRASSFRFDEPRRRYVVARGALRQLLGLYLGIRPQHVALTVYENRKPCLAARQTAASINFNVSHSGEIALIAFALGAEVGVDVEQQRDVHHLEQIARRFFHPSETNAVMAAPEHSRNLAFLRCWTGKEAVLKAAGTGIVGNLSDFSISIRAERPELIEFPMIDAAGKSGRCWLEHLNPCDGYVAAIACIDTQRTVICYAFRI